MSENIDFKELYDLRAEVIGLEYGYDRYTYRLIKKYFKNGQLALDLGCGRGSYLNPLAEKGVRVIGLDYSWKNVKLLREANRNVVWGDASHYLPFKEGLFDSVICSEFLEHFKLELVEFIINNISHIMKPGGYFFFTLPCKEKLQGSYCICPNCKHTFHRWGHLTSFNDKLIKDLLATNHFKIEKLMTIYGAQLYKMRVPLLLVRFLSLFDLSFEKLNMPIGTYLVIAKKE